MIIICGFIENLVGLVFIEFGYIKVLCIVSVIEGVFWWCKVIGLGWFIVEYVMLLLVIYSCFDCELVRGRFSGCI